METHYTPRGEKCDVLGREGEPPCEPAGIGEGSDGASPSQNGSIPTTRGITSIEPERQPTAWAILAHRGPGALEDSRQTTRPFSDPPRSSYHNDLIRIPNGLENIAEA